MSATNSKSEYAPVATVDEKSKLEKMELDETKVTKQFFSIFASQWHFFKLITMEWLNSLEHKRSLSRLCAVRTLL